MAREYEKHEWNEIARENLHLKASYPSAEATLSQGANWLKLVQDEEQAGRSEARMEVHATSTFGS